MAADVVRAAEQTVDNTSMPLVFMLFRIGHLMRTSLCQKICVVDLVSLRGQGKFRAKIRLNRKINICSIAFLAEFQMLFRCLVIGLFSCTLFSTEIDSYTERVPEFRDGLIELNRIMNRHIRGAIESANDEGRCDDQRLRDLLQKSLGGFFWTTFENEVIDSPLIDARVTPVCDSIYRDFTFCESFVLKVVPLGAITRIGDFYIGTDKYGHFLEEGYNFYNIIHKDKGTIEDAISFGEKGEREHFGLETTGIYSYGDLTADYDGLRFWENLVGKYVVCKNGKYKQHRSFNWKEYATAAWDEGINCNGYKTPEMEEKVNRRLMELEQKRGTRMTCPIAPEQCKIMIEHYGNVAKRLITPKCFQ